MRYKDYWDHNSDHRSQSNLEASTSSPFFRDSILQPHDPGTSAHPARSHWWDRSGTRGAQPESSFIEPPDFNRRAPPVYHENFSERSLEEEEHEDQNLDWRDSYKLSRTTYGDDLEEPGDINLLFDDVYSRPPDTPRINPEQSSFA